ncbi:MAG: RIP metalloprotease RseP [Candidatus Omnitrophica bacterium]|nr:RIP metalloprotease RseP [Candidatus Omnitrophota bacterium]
MMAFEGVLSGFWSTAIFLLVLSILIVVHEWGHFITAKLQGIQVDEFALGFGPTLWQRKWHGTNYMIKAFPLGGYVRMAGDEREKATGAPDEFFSKSPEQRALVVFNGPLINFVLAYVSFVLVFMLGYPDLSTKVTEVVQDGPAVTSGIQVGDRVVALNGKKLWGLMHMERLLEGTDDSPMTVTIERGGQKMDYQIKPEVEERPDLLQVPTMFREIGLGFLPNRVAIVDDTPADKAGLMPEDVIVGIDNMTVTNWRTLHEAVADTTGEFIKVSYIRDGKPAVMNIKPKIVERTDSETGEMKKVRQLGVAPMQDTARYRFGFLESFGYGWDQLWYITTLTYEALYRMVTKTMPARDSLTGPVGIFVIVQESAKLGLSPLIFTLGVISASLAIFNLLPMLPLDGGHLALLAVEKARGRPLSQKVDEFFAKLGFTFIILLALYVFYIDFDRFGWIATVKDFFTNLGK